MAVRNPEKLTPPTRETSSTEGYLDDALHNFLSVPKQPDAFREWKTQHPELDKYPNITDTQILVSCLYNRITKEQSLWTKRDDLSEKIMPELEHYLHESSKITAEIILALGTTRDRLKDLHSLHTSLQTAAREAGVQLAERPVTIEPEPSIVTFTNLLRQDKKRVFLNGPVLVVGLTTHGDIPAYVVSLLLNEKAIESQVVFIHPMSRDEQGTVTVLPHDRAVLEQAAPASILVVDDSIDSGGSMQQALAFLNGQFNKPKVVCIASAKEQSYLEEIPGEDYSTMMHEGHKAYTSASFLKPTTHKPV